MKRSLLLLSFILSAWSLFGQPGPGDYFCEYTWTTPNKEGNSRFFRVGGKLDYRAEPGLYPDLELDGERIPVHLQEKLKGAQKVEVMIEKVLCHDGTRGLSISVNGNEEVQFPESPYIPEPQEKYMHHFYPTVEIPLSDFDPEGDNFFSLSVDTTHYWNWPQNLVYGVIFRIYYKAPEACRNYRISARQTSEENIALSVSSEGAGDPVQVDYIARYEGPDMNGDGSYTDWHYHFFRSRIRSHIATVTGEAPEANWDISWLPDQHEAVKIAARITDQAGNIYFTEALEYVLERSSYSVELCKPYEQPEGWVTRAGEFEEKLELHGDVSKAVEARLLFTSWSPGYLNGIYLNDFLVHMREGPRYAFMQHTIGIESMDALQQGENRIRTGLTPLYHGEMVHGCEIMWPGIMMLIRYEH